MLTSALSFIALAAPGAAFAQVSNTATVTAPTGTIDSDTTNNSATDTDDLIDAVNDTVASTTAGTDDVIFVLANDELNGATATTSTVEITVAGGSSVPSQLTFDTTDGSVGVAAGAAAGTYTFDYQICKLDGGSATTICDTATVSVTVTAPTISAIDDSVTGVDGISGASNVLNVLAGTGSGPTTPDTLGGVDATTSNVNITLVTAASPLNGGNVPTLSLVDGNVSVPAGTPAGTYTITYRICDAVNTTNCDEADATVVVATPPIDAIVDSVTVADGVTGQANAIANVLANDTFDGGTGPSIGTSPGDVALTVETAATGIGGSTIVPVLDTADGSVDVPANTPAGTYTITYRIRDVLNDGSGTAPDVRQDVTDTATITITVGATVDLFLNKTNNDSDGVMSGDTLTYVLTIGNNGPDAAVGPVVRDVPGAGLTCPASNPLSFGGTAASGAPAGTPTVGDLTSTGGITLGTIGNGENVTITYSCTVD